MSKYLHNTPLLASRLISQLVCTTFVSALCFAPLYGHAQTPVNNIRQAPAGLAFPATEWETVASAEAVGFSPERLNSITPWLKTLDTSGMMVIVGGKVLYQYGDLKQQSYLASARKSILATLYGKYVENGQINLNLKLKDMQFSDVGGLQARELEARVEDLISARSGIYHPASNPGDDTASAPPRGSQRPGSYFLYNNWDFNAAGAVFEKLTGKDIHDAVQSDLAVPIGMQDYQRKLQLKSGNLASSQHPAYHMFFSTRDMARFGLLIAREGNWNGTQVVPRDWVRKMTSVVTPFGEMNPPHNRALGTGQRWAYGYMWWVWDAPNSPGPFKGAYTAIGAFGQYITVLPELDMVIAHKTATDDVSGEPKGVSDKQYLATLNMLIAARLDRTDREKMATRITPAEQTAIDLLKQGKPSQASAQLGKLAPSLSRSMEGKIAVIGYGYFNKKQFEAAIATLELNCKLFPQSANGFDSLAEVAVAAGDKVKAKTSYQKVLELLDADRALSSADKNALRANADKYLKEN